MRIRPKIQVEFLPDRIRLWLRVPDLWFIRSDSLTCVRKSGNSQDHRYSLQNPNNFIRKNLSYCRLVWVHTGFRARVNVNSPMLSNSLNIWQSDLLVILGSLLHSSFIPESPSDLTDSHASSLSELIGIFLKPLESINWPSITAASGKGLTSSEAESSFLDIICEFGLALCWMAARKDIESFWINWNFGLKIGIFASIP